MLSRRTGKNYSTRRIISAATAAAMMAWTASASATTYTWVGGASGDPNDFNNGANWTPPGPPGIDNTSNGTVNDVAYFNGGQTYQPQLTASDTLGEIDFNNSGWMLSSSSTSNVLTLDSNVSGGGGIGILSAASGLNEISANLSIGAAQTWEVATGGSLQIDGVISGSSLLTIGAAGYGGTVFLTNANTYSGGGLTVNTGTLELGGAGGNFGSLLSATAISIDTNGTFEINNTTAAGGNQNSRLSSPVLIYNGGGSFVYVGSDVAGTASSDNVGAVELNPGPISVMTVTLPSANSSGSATLNIGSINQYQPGSTSFPDLYGGSLLMNGANLGLTGGGTILSNSAPQLYGNSSPAPGAESIGSYSLQIAPFLLGESGMASGQGGTTTGTPNTFLTYNSTTGFRPLNPTDEFAHAVDDGSTGNSPTVGDNIYLTASSSAVLNNGNNSINSLVINGSGTPTLTIPNNTLTNSSGALLFVTNGGISGSGTYSFGYNPAYITVLSGQTGTFNVNVTGGPVSTAPLADVAMTVSGGGTLVFNGATTNFDQGVFADDATITFTNGWNPATTEIYLFDAFNNGTIGFGTGSSSTIPGSSDSKAMHMYMSGGTLNDNGALTFSNASGNYLVLHMGNGSTVNVGNPTSTPAASFIINDADGMAVEGLGGVSYFNVYPNATLTDTFGTGTGTGGNALRFGADEPGDEIMNLYGTGNFFEILLGDNSQSSAITGILGAIYLQPGSTFTVARTNTSGNNIFDIGSSGNGNTTNGQTNNFGYVSVPLGTSIGNGLATTSGEPGEIDIAGSSRGTPVGGGNGVMDVIGGTVDVYEILTLGLSTVNQQFSELNIVNSGSTPGTVSIGLGGSGSTVQMSAGTYGSYAVLNVINSALNNQIGTSSTKPNPNNAINLAGTTTYQGTSVMNASATALQTGILNIVGSSVVETNYVQSGAISVSGSYGQASSFINFNGGTLEYNNYSSSSTGQIGFVAQSVGGVYVYPRGAVLSGGISGGGTIAVNTGLFAPPGAGIQNITTLTAGNGIISGGSGYLTPPVVYITDSTGFDATGYAVMNYTYNAAGDITGGSVASVVITNPGFNLTNPTITFVGGGGSGASASIPAADIASNTSGGLTVQAGNTTINMSGNFAGTNASPSALYSFTSTNGTLGVANPGSGLGNNPYASGTYYGNTYPGIKNNTSTYTGPTVIETGTLELTTASGSSSAQSGPFAATNNNIPFSSVIVVGDTGPNNSVNDSGAILNITGIGGSGGFELAPGLVNSTTYNNSAATPVTYTYTTAPQVLAGFGTVKGGGAKAVGLTIGLASGSVTASTTGTTANGNNFGGYPYATGGSYTSAPTVNNSTVSPGYTSSGAVVPITSNANFYQSSNPYYGNGASGGGPIVVGQTTPASPTFTFNTKQGNAASLSAANATGALNLGGGTSTLTTLGAGGVYYWKLDMTNGGSGATAQPGNATASPGSTATTTVPSIGSAWDDLVMDSVAVGTATGSNAFTIQAVGFVSGTTVTGGTPVTYAPGTGSNPVSSGTMGATPYSWVIAQAPNTAVPVSTLQSLLADLSLNTSGLPKPAPGYEYFLSAQQDPSVGDADLVVNYAPAPEPTALSLCGLAAGALVLRRRRVKDIILSGSMSSEQGSLQLFIP